MVPKRLDSNASKPKERQVVREFKYAAEPITYTLGT